MKKGFTLVELSIVLVIIGLLVGGILIGQSMIQSAKINRFIRELQQYEIAINLFKKTYKYYPGESPAFSPPGAPDGELNYGDTNGDRLPNATSCNGAFQNTESLQVWAHLSQAKMLSKTYPAYSPNSCPGGTMTSLNYTAGKYTPYTEISGLTAEKWSTTKHPIEPIKYPNRNFALSFRVDMDWVFPLEAKLGSVPAANNAVGLWNMYGIGYCDDYDLGEEAPCNDVINGGEGHFYYYLPPN